MLELKLGDCFELLRKLPEASVDSVVTDPPYGISFMGKRWDYDVPSVEIWKECLRVLKPGGHALVACGTRTQHRMAVNIEDAGFEIRDVVTWLYGSGFPKASALNRSKSGAFCQCAANTHNTAGNTDAQRTEHHNGLSSPEFLAECKVCGKPNVDGWYLGGLKPACEFWTLARKPLEGTVAANVEKYGTGGLNIDGCRVEVSEDDPNKRRDTGGYISGESKAVVPNGPYNSTRPATLTQGRFPANLILDEAAAAALDEQSGHLHGAGNKRTREQHGESESIFGMGGGAPTKLYDRGGGASRFFFRANFSSEDLWPNLVSFAAKHSTPLSPLVDSAQKLAAIAEAQGAKPLSDLTTLSIVEMLNESANNGGETMPKILSIAERFSLALQLANMSQANHASNVEAHALTDIITTTQSLLKSSFSAELATSNTTLLNSEHGVKDSQSRFIYCAKASKSERNAGLDGTEQVSINLTSCKEENMVVAQLLQKVMSESMGKWSIAECGSKLMVQFPQGCRSITEMAINKTIESKILNCLIHSLTNVSTRDVSSGEATGSSHVGSVGDLRAWLLSITGGSTELALGASRVASETLPKIKESAAQPFKNSHSTVKPVNLMRYLCRLITPPKGIVLDPFMGSGSTGVAAKREGFDFIGIEREPEYLSIAEARINSTLI